MHTPKTIIKSFLSGTGVLTPPFGGVLALEGRRAGAKHVYLKHIGGEVLVDAFDYGVGDAPDVWKNLEIRLNGVAGTVIDFCIS